MKVKATKTIVNELKKHIPAGHFISLEQMSERLFVWYVDINTYKHENDYNPATEKFNVIKITYPENYFACDKYITTLDLLRIFKKSDGTLNGFINDFMDYIAI